MDIHIIDTYAAYRDLLAASGDSERETIFREKLAAPFAGLARIFGGGDPLATFRGWGMDPAHFGDSHREQLAAVIEGLAAGDAWTKTAQALDDAQAAFAPYLERVPLETIQFGLFVMRPSPVPGQRGYSGFGGLPGYIMVTYSAADEYTLPRIKGATVHELHHNIRNSLFPFNPMAVTVGDYIVLEGMAEAFAAELYGEAVVGFYVTDFDRSRFEESRRIIGEGLEKTGFDTVRSYIFGDAIAASQGRETVGVPDYAGYAIGYHVVRQYLTRTGKSVPEATFVPAREIIMESGFFDSGT